MKPENLRNTYCKDFPLMYVAKTNHLYLEYTTKNQSPNSKGFKLTYEIRNAGCGGVYTNSSGIIKMDDTSSIFNTECEWIIFVPESSSIYLEFENFNLPSESTECKKSFLKIFTNSTNKNELFGT